MLVETDNIASAENFRKHFKQYVERARKGSGPIAVTDNAEVVGFYISAQEYEVMFGAAVHDLLKRREKGPKVSHQAVKEHIAKVVQGG